MRTIKTQMDDMHQSMTDMQSELERLQNQPHTAEVINNVVDHVADLVVPRSNLISLVRMLVWPGV